MLKKCLSVHPKDKSDGTKLCSKLIIIFSNKNPLFQYVCLFVRLLEKLRQRCVNVEKAKCVPYFSSPLQPCLSMNQAENFCVTSRKIAKTKEFFGLTLSHTRKKCQRAENAIKLREIARSVASERLKNQVSNVTYSLTTVTLKDINKKSSWPLVTKLRSCFPCVFIRRYVMFKPFFTFVT